MPQEQAQQSERRTRTRKPPASPAVRQEGPSVVLAIPPGGIDYAPGQSLTVTMDPGEALSTAVAILEMSRRALASRVAELEDALARQPQAAPLPSPRKAAPPAQPAPEPPPGPCHLTITLPSGEVLLELPAVIQGSGGRQLRLRLGADTLFTAANALLLAGRKCREASEKAG